MFTAADIKLIRRFCLDDFYELLDRLNIEKPDFNAGDEFEIYEDLDKRIDNAICEKLKSSSLIEGYAKLLDCGMIEFQLNETMNELLKKNFGQPRKNFKYHSRRQ